MAASATRPIAEPAAPTGADDLPPCVAVAYSGGRDSTALLHATARVARSLGLRVLALHVHHGLQPQADAWLQQASLRCRRWARSGLPVTLLARRLEGAAPSGASIEAWARRERYAALAAMARSAGCGLVLLGHHRRDQAETWLLQALRGGASRALAAMPRSAQRDGIQWTRPWLDQPREAIEAYVRRHRLAYVDDGSNADPRFGRSRLRQSVWPALESTFPDAEQVLVAAARRAHEDAANLAALAAIDATTAIDDAALRLACWHALDDSRRANLLRHWAWQISGRGWPETLVRRLLAELPGARSGQWQAPGGSLHLYRGRLQWQPHGPAVQPAASAGVSRVLDLDRSCRHPWPGGWLRVQRVASGGIPAARLRGVRLAGRCGGERFQDRPGSLPRSLRKQFQAHGVPAWQRGGPLVWSHDGALLFVPGLGIDARAAAADGGCQYMLRWEVGRAT